MSYQVDYTPDTLAKLDEYIDSYLLYIKHGIPDEKQIEEMRKTLTPLVYDPIEYKKRLEHALEEDKKYEERHLPPNKCFGDSTCCYDRDQAWHNLYSRFDEKIKSMRKERALSLKSKLQSGLIKRRDKWLEYAFYKAEYVTDFREIIIYLSDESERTRDRKIRLKHSMETNFPWGIYEKEKKSKIDINNIDIRKLIEKMELKTITLGEKRKLLELYYVICKNEHLFLDLVWSYQSCDSWEDIFRDYDDFLLEEKAEGVKMAISEIDRIEKMEEKDEKDEKDE